MFHPPAEPGIAEVDDGGDQAGSKPPRDTFNRHEMARLLDLLRTSGRSDEALQLMRKYAEEVRTFDLLAVIAECLPDVLHITLSQIQTDYPHRANANTFRYQCFHPIDVPDAWPCIIFEKCLLLNSGLNRRIAERSVLQG